MKVKKNNKERGITLVALAITIIIIIILATVTINMAFGDNGLIKQAEIARDLTANSTSYETDAMANLVTYMNELLRDSYVPPTQTAETVTEAKENGLPFISKTTIRDEYNNPIVVPGGFKIAEDSGNTVQQGIVIEDVNASTDPAVQGSQFVWIPVGSFKTRDTKSRYDIRQIYVCN